MLILWWRLPAIASLLAPSPAHFIRTPVRGSLCPPGSPMSVFTNWRVDNRCPNHEDSPAQFGQFGVVHVTDLQRKITCKVMKVLQKVPAVTWPRPDLGSEIFWLPFRLFWTYLSFRDNMSKVDFKSLVSAYMKVCMFCVWSCQIFYFPLLNAHLGDLGNFMYSNIHAIHWTVQERFHSRLAQPASFCSHNIELRLCVLSLRAIWIEKRVAWWIKK